MKLVEHDGRRIAAIIYDAALDDEPELLDAVTAAAGLTLRSDRLQAELRAEVEFLDTVTNTVPSLLAIVGTDGRIQSVNAAALDVRATRARTTSSACSTGTSSSIPRSARDVEERFAALAPDFPPGSTRTRSRTREASVASSTGERRRTTTRPEPSPRSSPAGVDITMRRKRERELERERDVQTTVFETIPSVMVVLERDGTIRDRDVDDPRVGANRAFRQRLGWRDSELVGRPFLDLVVEDDDGRAARAIATAAAGTASDEIESELACADGSRRAFAWTAVPVADVTGRTDGLVLVSGMDVTERRRLEVEKERERAFLNAIANNAPSLLCLIDDEGVIDRARREHRVRAHARVRARRDRRPGLLGGVRRPGRGRRGAGDDHA